MSGPDVVREVDDVADEWDAAWEEAPEQDVGGDVDGGVGEESEEGVVAGGSEGGGEEERGAGGGGGGSRSPESGEDVDACEGGFSEAVEDAGRAEGEAAEDDADGGGGADGAPSGADGDSGDCCDGGKQAEPQLAIGMSEGNVDPGCGGAEGAGEGRRRQGAEDGSGFDPVGSEHKADDVFGGDEQEDDGGHGDGGEEEDAVAVVSAVGWRVVAEPGEGGYGDAGEWPGDLHDRDKSEVADSVVESDLSCGGEPAKKDAVDVSGEVLEEAESCEISAVGEHSADIGFSGGRLGAPAGEYPDAGAADGDVGEVVQDEGPVLEAGPGGGNGDDGAGGEGGEFDSGEGAESHLPVEERAVLHAKSHDDEPEGEDEDDGGESGLVIEFADEG